MLCQNHDTLFKSYALSNANDALLVKSKKRMVVLILNLITNNNIFHENVVYKIISQTLGQVKSGISGECFQLLLTS